MMISITIAALLVGFVAGMAWQSVRSGMHTPDIEWDVTDNDNRAYRLTLRRQ